MEMHQVRYFLAVARVLNFTRAADECNVTQPSLTRAIKQLEAELGGDLFRRERPAAQLTELGQRMHPLLKQCYEAATGARELASSFKSGEVGALRIALTHSVDLSLLIPHLDQIKRLFNRLEFRFLRGNSPRSRASFSRRAKPNSALPPRSARNGTGSTPGRCSPKTFSSSSTGSIRWRRATKSISTIFAPSNCCREIIANMRARVNSSLREHGLDVDRSHEIASERDLIELLEADIGVAVVPDTASIPPTLKRAAVEGLDARRTVNLYGVAGRERTAVASAVMRMLRGADWQQFIGKSSERLR